MEDYPSNAKSAAPQPVEKKIESVVTGGVIKRKTPIAKRFGRTFFGGDAKSAAMYAVDNILIPSAQKMFLEAITGGMSRLVYREPVSGGFQQGRPNTGSSFTPYGRFSTPNLIRKDEAPIVSDSARATHDFGEIILSDRVSAERVLNGMWDLLNEYEAVRVSDFYSLLGQSSAHTDQKFGWTDLRGSDIRMVPQGYLLILPQPKAI